MRDNPNITTAELHNILGVSETAVENNVLLHLIILYLFLWRCQICVIGRIVEGPTTEK
ncbi:MAG: hypothetical protein SOV61_01450 [Lachnospiraceae bacterium]|nr:hypothetical protein [Lachnospiraceae bacterium]